MDRTKMESTELKGTAGLAQRLMHLNYRKAELEETLKDDVEKVKNALRPSTIIRTTFADLKSNKEFRQNTIRQTLTAGAGVMLSGLLFKGVGGIKKRLLIGGAKKVFQYFMNKRKG